MQDLFGSSSEGSGDDDDAQAVLSDEVQPVDDRIDETQTASPDETLPSTQAHMDEFFGDDDSDEQEEAEEEHTRNMKGKYFLIARRHI